MRSTRIYRSPCHSGKGFLFRGVAALAIMVGTVAPARAANVSVQLALGAGHYAPTGAACAVSVPSGADGVAVLDAAVAQKCIISYHTVQFGSGTFVDCINEVCGDAATGFFLTYWALYWDGVAAPAGVDAFRAGTQGELGFSYVTWLNCALPPEVPNPSCDQF